MTPAEIIDYKIKPALAECQIHRQRLMHAWQDTRNDLAPGWTAGQPPSLNDDQVRTLDQVVYRFGRLQDSIGGRLLPAVLQLIGEWHEGDPFIDKLNRAEKLTVLPSAEQWLQLRELRNQTAHEYPDQPEKLLANLARLIEQVPTLERAFDQIRQFAEKRIATS